MPRLSKTPVLVFDGDPRVIEDFRIVLDKPQELGDESDLMGVAFESELIGSRSARGRFPEVNLTVKNDGHAAVECAQQAIERGQPFRIAFIDMGVPPGHWGLDTAAGLRALDPKLHIVLTISEPGPSPIDLSERIAPADFLSLLRKPLHAPEIEQLILSAETRHARETSEELSRSQARDVAAKALRDLPVGLIVADRGRRIVVASGAVSDIFPAYHGGLVPGTYLPEDLAWITHPNIESRQGEDSYPARSVRELRLDDGRYVITASSRSPDGGGMALFLDITDQKREQAVRAQDAQAAQLTENLTAFQRGVNTLFREYARPPGHVAGKSHTSSGGGDRVFADQLQNLIEQFNAAFAAPAEPGA